MKNINQAPMPQNKVVGQVLKNLMVNTTSDLGLFKKMIGNRPVNPQHVKRLSMSIKKYGMLVNPILVNENYEVIDGQHRLEAAKDANSSVYYIKVPKYGIEQVHALNVNQKNWTHKQFMEGYASMGLESYIKLKEFSEKHHYFNLGDCISLCSNITTSGNFNSTTTKGRGSGIVKVGEVFKEGTWKVRNLIQAEDEANKIKMIEPYFKEGYNSSTFVGTMLWLFHFKGEVFQFTSFLQKLKLQPTALEKCANRDQCKLLIEEIYNFKRRNKVNLRY